MTSAPHSLSCSTFVALLLLFGCASDDADDTAADASTTAASSSGEASTGDGSSSGGSSSTGPDLDALYDCVDPDLQIARPLVGPGYDPEMGLLEPLQEEYVVSATQILVKPESLEEFSDLVDGVVAELEQSEGMVAYSLAAEPNCGFARTLSVWRSPADMAAFAASDGHALAVSRTNEISITGKVTHWAFAADAFPPTYDHAREQLALVPPVEGY